MRVIVTITPAHQELLDELTKVPARERANRLRLLASLALLGRGTRVQLTEADAHEEGVPEDRRTTLRSRLLGGLK